MSRVLPKSVVASILLMLGWMAVPVTAQQNVGRIIGSVQDSSDAVIVGAKVTIRNTATGVSQEVVTSSAGAYAFPILNIGTYVITVMAPGFRTVESRTIRVVSGETTTEDFRMTLGQVSEVVTVTGDAVVVDSSTNNTGGTRTTEEINRLPLFINGVARDSRNFMRTLSGVSFSTTAGDRQIISRGAIHGTPQGTASYQVDGVLAVTAAHEQGEDNSAPLPEAVAEVSLSSSNNAEFGWNTGVTMSLITKSGTNEFHGTLFEYFRNDALDARNFFAALPSIQRQNEFGGVLGGRIIKNKLFFFGSYDAFRFRRAAAGQVVSVPTEGFRQGDFSGLLGAVVGTDRLGRSVRAGQIYDPATTRSDGAGGFLRDPFPGNIVPANRISSISKNLQQGYALPNRPGTQLNWVGSNINSPFDLDKLNTRLDYNVSASHRVTFSWDDVFRYRDFSLGSAAFSPDLRGVSNNITRQYRGRVAYTWLVRPNLILNFSGGFARAPRNIGCAATSSPSCTTGERVGLKGVLYPQLPTVAIDQISGFGQTFGTLGLDDPGQTVPVNLDMAWTKGSHNLKFGAQGIHSSKVSKQDDGSAGSFNFQNLTTGLPGFPQTGAGYASFLLGEVNSGSVNVPKAVKYRAGAIGFYIQDQWRVTPKLTLNYGLRWDFWLPVSESYDRIGIFGPEIPNPGAGGRLGALQFFGSGAGRNGRQGVTDRYFGSWGPRFGLAYSPNAKTVIRGSYGISYAPYYGNFTSGANLPPAGWTATQLESSLDNGLTPAFNWNNGFPLRLPALPRLDPTLQNGSAVFYIDPRDNKPARSQSINFGISRELPGNIVLKADYIGTLIHGLSTRSMIRLNQLSARYLSLGDLLLANINSPAARAAGIPIPYPTFTGSVAQALRPYPQYQSVDVMGAPSGFSTYNSLQLNLQKRFSAGLTFLAAYTFSKTLSNTSFSNQGWSDPPTMQDTAQRQQLKQLYNLHRPHNFVLSYTYELPFGRDKRYLRSIGLVANAFLGGWSVSGIQTYFSGLPVRVTTNQSLPGGFGGVWAIRNNATPVRTSASCSAIDPGSALQNRFLNIDAFRVPGPFTLGDTSLLPDIRSCPYFDESLSLQKLTRVTERFHLSFGVDAFNLFNRHQWDGLQANVSLPETFGRYTRASEPRKIQLQLKVNF